MINWVTQMIKEGKCFVNGEVMHICGYCVWLLVIWKVSGNKDLSQEGSPGLPSGPCPSYFHILALGLRLEGMCPGEWWFPSEHKLHVPQRDSQPQPLVGSKSAIPQLYSPQTAVRPHRTASCNVLFCSCCCYSNSNKISVSSLLKWRHLYAILQTLVRVLFFCFDWLFLTCKPTPLWSSKGKDPSRQTSAPHKGRLFMHSHPLWNEESELETNKFISPSPIERVIKSSSPFNHPNLPLTRTHVECGRDKPLTALSFKKSLVWD